jgi:hypothetical protein
MNILVTELIWPEGLDELEASGSVAYHPGLWRDPRRLRKEIEIIEALIVRNQTRVDAALLESGASLKAIGRLGVGLDNIDLAAARDRESPLSMQETPTRCRLRSTSWPPSFTVRETSPAPTRTCGWATGTVNASPARREPPVIVDMSSSVVARVRIMLAATEGQTIPKGWVIDEEELETTDAAAAPKEPCFHSAGQRATL